MIRIVAKFLIGLSLISILSVVSVNVTQDHCPSNEFILSTIKTDGYKLRATSNSNVFFVTTDNLKAQITIGRNGVSVTTSSNRGVPMKTNFPENHERQLEFSNETAARSLCESQELPDGYQLTSGIGAHKYHNSKKNWNDARKTCINEGGHLLVINSNAEERLIVEQTKAYHWAEIWLGIHDLFSYRDWVTVRDIPLDEVGWATWTPFIVPNPDNSGGNQHCIRFYQQSGMDDIACDHLMNFVCEISCDYPSPAHELNEVYAY